MGIQDSTFRRRLWLDLATVLLFVILAVFATWPLAAHLTSHTLAGPDPLIDLWTVHWLSGHIFDPGQLFAGNIFHPDPHAVVYSDLSLGTAVLLVPLRLFVHDPLPLYNLGVLLALAFSAWSFSALARELTGSRSAGLLAGIAAGFGSHQLFHVYHLNLLSSGWLALLLLALHRMFRRPGPAPILLAAVSFALAAQSSGYYAVAATLLALVFAAWHWRGLRLRRTWMAAAISAVLAAGLIAPYAHAFLDVKSREDLRRPKGVSTRLAFVPARDLGSQCYLYRGLVGTSGERLFPGLLTPFFAALALLRRRPGAGFYATAAVLLLILSLGPELVLGSRRIGLPYAAFFALPPLDAMRHPFTFAAVAAFLCAVLAAIGWSGTRLSRRPWAATALVAMAIAETWGPPPMLRAFRSGLPPVYRLLETLPPGPVLEVPVTEEETLLWAARHGRPTVNGVGAFLPRSTGLLDRYVQNHWMRRTPDDIDNSPPTGLLTESFPSLRYLIIPTGRRPSLAPLADAVDRSSAFVPLAMAEDGDRLYRFRPELARYPVGLGLAVSAVSGFVPPVSVAVSPFPAPAPSNRACGFPAHGFPPRFAPNRAEFAWRKWPTQPRTFGLICSITDATRWDRRLRKTSFSALSNSVRFLSLGVAYARHLPE